jgi:hypothetical protein
MANEKNVIWKGDLLLFKCQCERVNYLDYGMCSVSCNVTFS